MGSNLCAFVTDQVLLPMPFFRMGNLQFDPDSAVFTAFGDDFQNPFDDHPAARRPYSFQVVDGDGDSNIGVLEGTTVMLCEPVGMATFLFHFFHLLEHLVGLWCLDLSTRSEDVARVVFVGDGQSPMDSWRGPNQLNEHLLKALFPNARMQTWREFTTECQQKGGPVLLVDVVISDRSHTRLSPACGKINKMLGEALPHLDSAPLQTLAECVWAYVGCNPSSSPQLRVTYTQRNPPRTLAPAVEDHFLATLRAMPNVNLRVVDFARLSFAEQIRQIADTDLLIGVHGNGLCHLLFLPEDAAVIELLPHHCNILDYRLFADARRLTYYGVSPEMGVVDRDTAYELGFLLGEHNSPITTLDQHLIGALIKQRMKAHQ
jgi:hypothetical protein